MKRYSMNIALRITVILTAGYELWSIYMSLPDIFELLDL
jgi:hypothetical protein